MYVCMYICICFYIYIYVHVHKCKSKSQLYYFLCLTPDFGSRTTGMNLHESHEPATLNRADAQEMAGPGASFEQEFM